MANQTVDHTRRKFLGGSALALSGAMLGVPTMTASNILQSS